MAELQRLATSDGGSSMMSFMARAGASPVGRSAGLSSQDGVSGGDTRQQGDSSSSGTSEGATVTEGIHHAALASADELARLFDRKTGRQIVLIDGQPVALRRANYDTEAFFTAVPPS